MRSSFLRNILLWIGAGFFFFEAVLHFFGLPILEHDVIFLSTHDRYIALFALTYAVLLFLISTDIQKYRTLFFLTMGGLFLAMLIASSIAFQGGYTLAFATVSLDSDLRFLGIFFLLWYLAVLFTFFRKDL